MMDYEMTNRNTGHGLMASTMEEIKKDAGDEIMEVIADNGHQQPEDMIECLEKRIIPNVILPDGQEIYELEIKYEEKGYDKSGKSACRKNRRVEYSAKEGIVICSYFAY